MDIPPTQTPLSGEKSLVDRAKAIIIKPKDEWPLIAAENKTQSEILTGYVLPLAAIGPVASFLGGQLFGYGGFGFSFQPSLMGGLTSLVVSYIVSIIGVFVLAFIANFLAPKFEGQANSLNAFKLVAYSYTAGWVAGVFGLIPALAVFGLLGLYSIYLLYLGASPLMKVPENKAGGYTAVTIVCAIILALIVTPITAAVTGLFVAGPALMSGESYDGNDGDVSVNIPGVGKIDTGEIEAAAAQAEKIQKGEIKPVSTETLKALLPGSIGNFTRTASSTQAIGQMGSTAEATYTAGDQSFTMRVSDMSALGALAGIGSAMGVEQSREDANGYERTQTVDGQMQTESWNNTSNSGKFGRMVATRFMVEAEGTADSIDQLKAAVAAVDMGKLAALAQ